MGDAAPDEIAGFEREIRAHPCVRVLVVQALDDQLPRDAEPFAGTASHGERHREVLVEGDVPPPEAEDRELRLGTGEHGPPGFDRGVESVLPIPVGEGRLPFVPPAVVGDVAPRTEDHAIGDVARLPEAFDDEIEELAAACAHPGLFGLDEAVVPETDRERGEPVEERTDLVAAGGGPTVADRAFVAGRTGQDEPGLRLHRASHLDRFALGPASAASPRMTELDEHRKGPGCPLGPRGEQLHSALGVDGADDL